MDPGARQASPALALADNRLERLWVVKIRQDQGRLADFGRPMGIRPNGTGQIMLLGKGLGASIEAGQ